MIIPAEKSAGQNSAYRHRNMKGAFGNEGALRFSSGCRKSIPKTATSSTSSRCLANSWARVLRSSINSSNWIERSPLGEFHSLSFAKPDKVNSVTSCVRSQILAEQLVFQTLEQVVGGTLVSPFHFDGNRRRFWILNPQIGSFFAIDDRFLRNRESLSSTFVELAGQPSS